MIYGNILMVYGPGQVEVTLQMLLECMKLKDFFLHPIVQVPEEMQLEELILLDHFGSLVDITSMVFPVIKWRIEKNLTYIKGYLNDLWKYSNNEWTWISGNNTRNASGIYGTKGISSPFNYPGARGNAVGGIDSSGSFWLFGGYGYDINGNIGK